MYSSPKGDLNSTLRLYWNIWCSWDCTGTYDFFFPFLSVICADLLLSLQTSIIVDKKAQEKCALTIYPQQQLNGISVRYPQEVKIYSGSNRPNKTASLAFKTPVLQSNFSSVRENMVSSTVSSQPQGGVLVLPPVSLFPSMSSTVGYTDYR